MSIPQPKKVDCWQITVYAMKHKDLNILSVFEDAESLMVYLDNDDRSLDIEWIKPIYTNVTAPGVDSE